ncbi:class I SAM-dependent methyltransferase [Streptomyces sp. NPDC058953]|uniref:class I SAM-dependent methyltransferase n=1 Tax=unclassified Streptomyces TaxID=2593676 RepID=UPI0036CCA040
MSRFEDLIAEGTNAPTEGWDFSWFAGRATERRPSWGYATLLADRMARAGAALDVQTGGGEVLASVPVAPPVLVATESWPPNLDIARRNLAPLGGLVVEAGDEDDLPFPAEDFDLVVSRHPVVTRWDEIRRVLRPGGTYLSQQVGAGSVRELTEFLMGPRAVNEALEELGRRPLPPGATTSGADPVALAAGAEAAGLDVVDLRTEALRMEFHDIAAVVHFLRKVIWTVPGFTVDAYRPRLAELHGFMERHGPFVAYARRCLVEARRG